MMRFRLTEIESSLVASLLLSAVAALMILVQAQAAGEVNSSNFHREVNCGEQVPLDPGQAYHVTMGLGRLGCAKLCAQEEACLSYTTSDPDCLLYPVRLQTCGRSPSPPHASYYFKNCYHGGNPQMNGCACLNHTAGSLCQHVMRDCTDWMQWSSTSGVYWVQPPAAPYPFPVRCQMEARGKTFVQWHNKYDTAVVSFNRTWEEYKEGFGDLSTRKFWLGLRKLYWLTAGRALQFNMAFYAVHINGTIITPSRSYGRFLMGNESTNFEMLQFMGGTQGPQHVDCLAEVIGSKFVTFDHGDSAQLRGCAGTRGAGWWLKSTTCNTVCNPNGRIKASRFDPDQPSDVYFQGLDSAYRIDEVSMFLDQP